MGNMFTDAADLSGLLENGVHLEINTVVHKAFIEVNEKGAEVTGATGKSKRLENLNRINSKLR